MDENKKNGKGRKIALIIIAVLLAAAVIVYLCTTLVGSKPAEPEDSAEPTESVEPADPKASDKPQSSSKPETSDKPEASQAPATSQETTQVVSTGNNGSTGTQTNNGTQTGTNQNASNGNNATQTGSNQNTGAEHTHQWQPVYKTVHHDEVGHYETVVVQAAWDEEVTRGEYVCNACGYIGSDVPDHIWDAHDGAGSYGVIPVPTGEVIHHDEVTEQKWVVDTSAYDEQVIDYYACSCGLQKSA